MISSAGSKGMDVQCLLQVKHDGPPSTQHFVQHAIGLSQPHLGRTA